MLSLPNFQERQGVWALKKKHRVMRVKLRAKAITFFQRAYAKLFREYAKLSYAILFPETILIHVGKSGGSSLRLALNQIGVQYSVIHVMPVPIVRERARYYLLLRSPVSRAISAFNWRYKLVVTDEVQKTRFPGEYEILKNYGSINNLAEALYTEGNANADAIADFRSIHHLKESIAYYFSVIPVSRLKSRIAGVLFQESMATDFERLFNKPLPGFSEKRNKKPIDDVLSDRAKRNLVRILESDYTTIEELFNLGFVSRETWDYVQCERRE